MEQITLPIWSHFGSLGEKKASQFSLVMTLGRCSMTKLAG